MSGETFQIVVLGCSGGPRETNLSGYLLSTLKKQAWISLDAGSLLAGIDAAFTKNQFSDLKFDDPQLIPAVELLTHHVQGYLISHAHLDHIAGMVLNSPLDPSKYILGIDQTIDNLRDHIFNGRIWPNYGNEGLEPRIGRYHYIRLPLHQKMSIPRTDMAVEAYLLNHPHGYPSSAFLIESQGKFLLYFGDTSSDSLEIDKHLTRIWQRISPLLKNGTFSGMLLECSYTHADADQVIYGHLDTRLMLKELKQLSEISQTSLHGLKVIVTHRKERLHKGFNAHQQIADELTQNNDLGINFLFPTPGDRFFL